MRHRPGFRHFVDRIFGDLFHRQRVIDDAVDEGGVRTVFKQAPDEVRQQVLVAANRRVDATGVPETFLLHHHAVKVFTHAVKPLEFVIQPVSGQLGDGGDGVSVVRGELGIKRLAVRKHLARAGNVGDIRIGLAREHGKSVEAFDLGVLDFRIPVSALDQANRYALPAPGGQRGEPVDHRGCPLLVGLQCKSQPVPARQGGFAKNRCKHVQRQHQAVGLFGVHGQGHAIGHCEL